jgi:hypothetical protein
VEAGLETVAAAAVAAEQVAEMMAAEAWVAEAAAAAGLEAHPEAVVASGARLQA